MRICYFHPYGGGPGVGRYFRPYELGRRWVAAGHEVNVFVASDHHLLDQGRLNWREKKIDGITYHALPTRAYRGNGVGRILNMADYAWGMIGQWRTLRPDIVISSSPHPLGVYGGWLLSRLTRAPFIYEIRDLWPLSLVSLLGVSRFHPFVLLCAHAERLGAKGSDMVAGLLPGVGDYFNDRNVPVSRFEWLPNGANLEPVQSVAPVSENGRRGAAIAETWRREGRVIMVAAGSLGPPNGIGTMLDALEIAVQRVPAEKLGVLLIGDGILRESLQKQARIAGLENVAFIGAVPKAEALYLIDQSDFGYAGIQNIAGLYRYGTSLNKIMDYLQAGKPAVFPMKLKGEPVHESGAGYALDAPTVEMVSNALISMVEMTPEDRRRMGELGKEHLRKYFDWDLIAERYVQAIEQIASQRRQASL